MNAKEMMVIGSLLAVTQMVYCQSGQNSSTNPKGKCFGIVGAGEGECGGKDPANGKTWSCAGQNPTADLGWKKSTKSECDSATKHKSAKEKKFVAAV